MYTWRPVSFIRLEPMLSVDPNRPTDFGNYGVLFSRRVNTSVGFRSTLRRFVAYSRELLSSLQSNWWIDYCRVLPVYYSSIKMDLLKKTRIHANAWRRQTQLSLEPMERCSTALERTSTLAGNQAGEFSTFTDATEQKWTDISVQLRRAWYTGVPGVPCHVSHPLAGELRSVVECSSSVTSTVSSFRWIHDKENVDKWISNLCIILC